MMDGWVGGLMDGLDGLDWIISSYTRELQIQILYTIEDEIHYYIHTKRVTKHIYLTINF
jgi:hypothetical protein